MATCLGCSARLKKAAALARESLDLHKASAACEAQGHSGAAAQDMAPPGTQHGQTNYFESAANGSDFYKRLSQRPDELEASGGLRKG
jgi:hypothetical protein